MKHGNCTGRQVNRDAYLLVCCPLVIANLPRDLHPHVGDSCSQVHPRSSASVGQSCAHSQLPVQVADMVHDSDSCMLMAISHSLSSLSGWLFPFLVYPHTASLCLFTHLLCWSNVQPISNPFISPTPWYFTFPTSSPIPNSAKWWQAWWFQAWPASHQSLDV